MPPGHHRVACTATRGGQSRCRRVDRIPSRARGRRMFDERDMFAVLAETRHTRGPVANTIAAAMLASSANRSFRPDKSCLPALTFPQIRQVERRCTKRGQHMARVHPPGVYGNVAGSSRTSDEAQISSKFRCCKRKWGGQGHIRRAICSAIAGPGARQHPIHSIPNR